MSELSVRETAARAIWEHDHRRPTPAFPTGDPYVDDPYYCRGEDVLAAVADHDGLAGVLAAHVQHEEQAIVDGHVWCASCDTQIGDWTRERGIEALDAMWTAHLVDVVRAWLRGES